MLTRRLGTVRAAVPHEGTTASCPACPRVAPKPLGLRMHDCPCGLRMPRDHVSAVVILAGHHVSIVELG